MLLSLWPVLLIFAGLQLIFGRRTAWLSALLGVALLVLVCVVLFAGQTLGIKPISFWSISGVSSSWPVRETVEGSGVMAEETVSVSGFNKVDLETVGNLEIVQGTEESLVVEAEDNLLPHMTFTVRGDTLTISVENGIAIRPTESITYRLTVTDLEEVNLSGAGAVNIAALETGSLEVNSSGAGNFKIEDLQAEDLSVQLSGAGSVTAAGQVEQLKVNISGAGSFNGADLQTSQADIEISGLGKATVWVTDELQTQISGAGSISYYGNPEVSESNSGAGFVQKIGDK
jgi:hypothetical protein